MSEKRQPRLTGTGERSYGERAPAQNLPFKSPYKFSMNNTLNTAANKTQKWE
jgi:hypothetical protein